MLDAVFSSTLAKEAQAKSMPPLIPDVTDTPAAAKGSLNWVGMQQVELPLRIKSALDGSVLQLLAKLGVFVNLGSPSAKGIHMSRIYNLCFKALADPTSSNVLLNQDQKLNLPLLLDLGQKILQSQSNLSHHLHLRLSFELPILRQALKSDAYGWRHYPVSLTLLQKNKTPFVGFDTKILYSSTCPCSAILAQQLNNQSFNQAVSSGEVDRISQDPMRTLSATAHAQKSAAFVQSWFLLEKASNVSVLEIINSIENCLGTPVQAAVKRQDEQEFAKLNAQNLMFCEDAARKIKHLVSLQKPAPFQEIQAYKIRVEHYESLHPHTAAAQDCGGKMWHTISSLRAGLSY